MNFIHNNKKMIGVALVGIFLIITGLLSWKFYFSKYKVFYDYENEFREAVEFYYRQNPNYLPAKGETREMTLQNLYNGNHVGDFNIPGSKKLCDSNSWVRVYQSETGEYEYITYLKCGKYESNVDHIGPQVILNGDSKVVINLGSSYEEFGVKSVHDNRDGKIDPTNVVIDSSKVDTSNVGAYPVTYTVLDQTYNKTVITRMVVVARSLADIVMSQTDETNYYKGTNVNNYLLFSGMLWRIVNLNEDGTIQLVSDSLLSNLRSDYDNYQNSNVDRWFTDYFYPLLNSNSKKYLVSRDYCVGNTSDVHDLNSICSSTINSMVGLLDVSEYFNTFQAGNSFLCTNSFYLLGGELDHQKLINNCSNNEKVDVITPGLMSSIRASITLKANLFISGGDGSNSNPYKLDDYEYAKVNDQIHTRLVGEYLVYSGMTFRIIGFDKSGNAKVILSEPWTNMSTKETLRVSFDGVDNCSFNLSDTSHPGYILNHELIEYIDEKGIVISNFDIPINTNGKTYQEYQKNSVKAKIALPTTYDLFATAGDTNYARNEIYLYLDSSSNNKMIFMLNGANAMMFEIPATDFYSYAIRPVMYLKSNLKVMSGYGTLGSPYYVK